MAQGDIGDRLPKLRMPILPFKLNQERRHRFPRQQRRVTNWPAYDASLRQRGSLMGQSSGCFEARLKGRPGMNDGPKHVHAASCEGDDGLARGNETFGFDR